MHPRARPGPAAVGVVVVVSHRNDGRRATGARGWGEARWWWWSSSSLEIVEIVVVVVVEVVTIDVASSVSPWVSWTSSCDARGGAHGGAHGGARGRARGLGGD